eukprot:2210881-Pyramimonas_sp.AAC.1
MVAGGMCKRETRLNEHTLLELRADFLICAEFYHPGARSARNSRTEGRPAQIPQTTRGTPTAYAHAVIPL